jgi:hypothetical protein
MNSQKAETVIKELDTIINYYDNLRKQSKYGDLSDLGDSLHTEAKVRLTACLDRLAPPNSPYRDELGGITVDVLGALKALREDYSSGYISNIETLIQGDLISDFLEMSEYFLENNYKDPAAVIAGAVLEENLRLMCAKKGIETIQKEKSIKSDLMNAELAKAQAINKLDQKSITAWLDLRNKAAHGKFSEYTQEQVKLMVQGIRDFIARNIGN